MSCCDSTGRGVAYSITYSFYMEVFEFQVYRDSFGIIYDTSSTKHTIDPISALFTINQRQDENQRNQVKTNLSTSLSEENAAKGPSS